MPSIAGEAAVRIVPTVRGFHSDVKRKLEQKRIEYAVDVRADINNADMAKIAAYRKAQEANPVTIKVRTDWNGLRRDISQVEHIFKRNSFSRALRLNVVIAGLDALPALTYAAAGATASLDTLAKAALVLPGVLGGALASVGTLATGLHGVKDAFTAFGQEQKKTAETARLISDGNRQLQRSYRDYGTAVRDTIRDIQDLNAENRRSSLNVADAILGVQEAADRLRSGGQRTVLELRRDQLSYLQAVDRLQEVNTKAKRVAEDTAEANAKGVQGADKVADALDQINKNIEKLDTDKLSEIDKAMAKLSPNAQSFVTAVRSLSDEWTSLQNSVQDKLFDGLDKSVVELANNSLPALERGMGRLAVTMNGSIKNLATELGSGNSTSLMEQIFGNTDVGLQRLSVGFKPFIDGMLKLTKESSDFLPRLGDAGAKVAERFRNWIYDISSDGRLDSWISRGLDGFTSLGRAVGSIGNAITSLTKAFDGATGNRGGFLKLFETQAKKLSDYLKSPKGKNDLNSYFSKTQDFIRQLKEAYVDIRPLVKDVVEAARDWSVFLFKSIGYVASFTQVLERHTGILKPLIGLYFFKRTAQPVWDLLSSSFKAYANLVESAANNQTFGKFKGIQWTYDKLEQMRGKAKEAAAAVAEATNPKANPKSYAQVDAATTPSGKPSYVSPLVEAQRNRQAEAERAASTPGSLQDRLNNATVMAGQRDAVARGEKLLAAADFEAKNPPYVPIADATKTRSSNPDARKAANRERRRLENFIGATPSEGTAKMQGPQLPPEGSDFWKRVGDSADDAAVSIGDAGDAAGKAAEQTENLSDKSKDASKSVDAVADKSGSAKKPVDKLADSTSKAAKSTGALSSSASKAASATDSVGKASGAAAPGVDKLKSSVSKAAGEVGEGKVGLMGRLVGLAGFFAPAAALTVGLGAVTWLVNKMGEAHRNAAEAARNQENALRQLVGTLDSVTGGFTRATLAETANQAASFTEQSGLFPAVDVNGMVRRLGFDPTTLYTNASDPSKAQAYQSDIAIIDSGIEQQLKASPEYIQNKEKFDAYGLDSFTLAKALRGDPQAVAAVRSAEQNKKFVTTPGGKSVPINTPDLGRLAVSLPNKDAFFAGRFLNDRNSTLATAGAAIASGTQAVGRARLTAAGGLFNQYGVDPMIVIDPATGNGVVQIRQMPDPATLEDWSSKGITVRDNGPGAMATVTIDPAEASKYLEGYASGGMVRGPGGPTDDAVLARVSAGEHITNASAVGYYGSALFDALNNKRVPKFAPGGWPWLPLAPMPSPDPSGGGVGSVAAPMPPAAPKPPAVPMPPAAPAPPVAPLPAEAGYTAPPATPKPAAVPANSPFLSSAVTGAPQPITPFLPGTLLPPSRTGGEGGLQVNTIGLKRTIETLFPAIQSIGGFREDAIADHPSGAAIDVMIPGYDTAEGKAYGDQIAAWLQQNGAALGVKSFIWQDTWNPITEDGEAHRLGREGDTQGHYDHLHILTNGGGFPSGNEQYKMPATGGMAGMNPAVLQALSGVFPGGIGALLQGLPGGGFLGGVTSDMLTNGTAGGGQKKDPTTEFLEGIASSGGASLLGIGTSFLTGITGIDFGSIVGTAQKIGGAAIEAWGPKTTGGDSANPGAGTLNSLIPGLGGLLGGGGDSGGGASSATDVTGSIIGGMVNGQLPLESPNVQNGLAATGFNQNLDGTSPTGGGNGDVSASDISAAVDQVAPMLGIKNKSAWVSALVKASQGGGAIFPSSGTGVQRATAALMTAVREWGIDPQSGAPLTPKYAAGGSAASGLAWLSNGEFRTSPSATSHYGPDLFNALNAKAIPRSTAKGMAKGKLPRFAPGGWPIIPDPILNPPASGGGQSAGPLPMQAPAPLPPVPEVPVPDVSVGAQQGTVPVPSTGGEPGPGATAPAPDPGSLPGVADALSGTGMGGMGGGLAQPGAAGPNEGDPRGTLGAAPTSQNHNSPVVSGAISGIASSVGSIASMAAQAGMMAGTMGAGAAMPGAGGAAGAGIQAGAQMAGAIATGAVNVLSSLLVGTATNGSTASASGVPLLPQRPEMQSGVPSTQPYQDNRTYNLTNLDEYKRVQERDMAQNVMPFVGKY